MVADTSHTADPLATADGLPDSEVVISDEVTSENIVQLPALGEGVVVSEGEVEALAAEGAARWEATGLTAEQKSALNSISYAIADIDGLHLGSALDGVVTIDSDAAGQGWFVDETADEDEEYVLGADGVLRAAEEIDGVDLLSVIMHEQGHILGLLDLYSVDERGNLMHGAFGEGERRLPTEGQADGAIVGSVEGTAYADVTVTNLLDDDGASGSMSLRQALDQSVDGNIITLNDGTYVISKDDGGTTPLNDGTIDSGSNENVNATGDFDIVNKNITIQGAGEGVTFIDAQQLDRIFHILGGSQVTIKDLTIQNGAINYSHGGAIAVENTGGLTLEMLRFRTTPFRLKIRRTMIDTVGRFM